MRNQVRLELLPFVDIFLQYCSISFISIGKYHKFVNKSILIAGISLAAVMSVAIIVESLGQPAMAITQRHNGVSSNSGRGTDANGASGGSIGSNGGVGGDAPKAGTGTNGGTNSVPGGLGGIL